MKMVEIALKTVDDKNGSGLGSTAYRIHSTTCANFVQETMV